VRALRRAFYGPHGYGFSPGAAGAGWPCGAGERAAFPVRGWCNREGAQDRASRRDGFGPHGYGFSPGAAGQA
jgi:hypothetical protein